MDLVRSLVSKQKRRWEADGFNLDLTYITDAIIAMGFPSEGTEGLFRNPLGEVQRFLRERHGEHFHVYNLCIERSYKPEKFAGRVSVFPFADHNAPPLHMIREFCAHVDAWMKEDVKNVVAIHCKAGKGRTGTMICCYLLYCGAIKTSDDVLEFYGARRTYNGHGVTIPSQRRYVHYFGEMLKPTWDTTRERSLWSLRRIWMSHVPKSESGEAHHEWKPLVGVTRKDKTLLYVGQDDQQLTAEQPEFYCDGLVVQGDLKFELFNGKSTKRVLWLWINTAFIPPKECTVTLSKSEIDGICKDKEHKIVPADFTMRITFERVMGRARANKGSRAPAPNPMILDLKASSPPPAALKPGKRPSSITISPGTSSPKSGPSRDPSPAPNKHDKSSAITINVNGQQASGDGAQGANLQSDESTAYSSLDFASLHLGMSESLGGASNMVKESAIGGATQLVCDVCSQPIVDGTDSVNSQSRILHWACAMCAVCAEPIANRGSCSIADTTTIHGAIICSSCDTFWERCPHCKRPLQDGGKFVEVPTLGKRCNACFCCSICQAQFSSGDDDDDDDETDSYEIVSGALICHSHSASSRKIYAEHQRARPRSNRFGGPSSDSLSSVPQSPASPPPLQPDPPSNPGSSRFEASLRPSRPKSGRDLASNKLSLRRLKGIAVEMPRCGLCHGLIDVNCESVFVEQLKKSFHVDHFKCSTCRQGILSGELYHIVDDLAHCNDCYTTSSVCHKCQLPLLSSKIQVAPEVSYHQSCFTCESCKQEISANFVELESKPFCTTCYDSGAYKAHLASMS